LYINNKHAYRAGHIIMTQSCNYETDWHTQRQTERHTGRDTDTKTDRRWKGHS